MVGTRMITTGRAHSSSTCPERKPVSRPGRSTAFPVTTHGNRTRPLRPGPLRAQSNEPATSRLHNVTLTVTNPCDLHEAGTPPVSNPPGNHTAPDWCDDFGRFVIML
jgi:hypothetical protein